MSEVALRPDHLIVACRDVDRGVRFIEGLLGVSMAEGGRHPGRGTRNVLLGLTEGAYLEVVGVDAAQPTPAEPRWLGVDDSEEPRLVTWCLQHPELAEVPGIAAGHGVDIGSVTSASRARPDGSVLSWSFTDPAADRLGGVVPFFIDWGASRHPSDDLDAAASLLSVRVEHPEADRVSGLFSAMGVPATAVLGHPPRVVATLKGPNGIVELSG